MDTTTRSQRHSKFGLFVVKSHTWENLQEPSLPGMMMVVRVMLLVASVSAHGSGAWKDPNHYDPAKGLYAGMRYISEGLWPGAPQNRRSVYVE